MRRLVTRPSPAWIVALVALFVALGGPARAARCTGRARASGPDGSAGSGGSGWTDGAVRTGRGGWSNRSEWRNGTEPPDGPAGATSVVVRTEETTDPVSGSAGAPEASCEEGERATGGGVAILDAETGDYVQQTFPLPEDAGSTPTGWTGLVYIATVGGKQLRTYVVCASP